MIKIIAKEASEEKGGETIREGKVLIELTIDNLEGRTLNEKAEKKLREVVISLADEFCGEKGLVFNVSVEVD